MLPAPKQLIVVVGPTGVGKTTCCIQLAQYLQAEIISADARQCYQGMRIGTAQPTAEDMQNVPHHLINCLPLQQPYNAALFARDAHNILERLWKQHNQVLVTGGSGLYINALCQGLDHMPHVPPTIRTLLQNKLHKEGLPVLAKMLSSYDPQYYRMVDKANPQRILRALEICLATGKPYSTFRTRQPPTHAFRTIMIGLQRERQELYQRIDQRVDEMLQQGLIQEATTLYPYRHYNALQTIGYREIFGYLAGHYDQAAAISLLKRNTRRYAKRQLTWFKRHRKTRWFHPNDVPAILRHIQQTKRS